jgi:hypothetical protein
MRVDVKVREAFSLMTNNWEAIAASDMEDASETADRFETSFYHFISVVGDWIRTHQDLPMSADDVFQLPIIAEILVELPNPLELNFKLELEAIAAGVQPTHDDTEY